MISATKAFFISSLRKAVLNALDTPTMHQRIDLSVLRAWRTLTQRQAAADLIFEPVILQTER